MLLPALRTPGVRGLASCFCPDLLCNLRRLNPRIISKMVNANNLSNVRRRHNSNPDLFKPLPSDLHCLAKLQDIAIVQALLHRPLLLELLEESVALCVVAINVIRDGSGPELETPRHLSVRMFLGGDVLHLLPCPSDVCELLFSNILLSFSELCCSCASAAETCCFCVHPQECHLDFVAVDGSVAQPSWDVNGRTVAYVVAFDAPLDVHQLSSAVDKDDDAHAFCMYCVAILSTIALTVAPRESLSTMVLREANFEKT